MNMLLGDIFVNINIMYMGFSRPTTGLYLLFKAFVCIATNLSVYSRVAAVLSGTSLGVTRLVQEAL
jgi:hypothetical protein